MFFISSSPHDILVGWIYEEIVVNDLPETTQLLSSRDGMTLFLFFLKCIRCILEKHCAQSLVSSFFVIFLIMNCVLNPGQVKRSRGRVVGKDFKPCDVTEAVLAVPSQLEGGGRKRWVVCWSRHLTLDLGLWCAVAVEMWNLDLEKLATLAV